jgi:hypothetical protein
MRRRIIISVFVALAVNCTFAGEDQDAYCKYILEEASAQRDLLRTPSATAGVVQPNTGLPAQLVWGASTSIASIRKAGLTIAVARRNCELYQATTAAQQQIVYALPALEKTALSHRLELIQQADSQLDVLIAEEVRLVEAQNVTQPMLYSLHAGKVKLYKDRADTQAKAALLYTPAANPSPIKELVNTKQASEVANQKAIDHLVRQDNWDVTFEAGMRHQANPFFAYGVGPYVTTSLSYNLASKAIDRHLDAAANSYAAW